MNDDIVHQARTRALCPSSTRSRIGCTPHGGVPRSASLSESPGALARIAVAWVALERQSPQEAFRRSPGRMRPSPCSPPPHQAIDGPEDRRGFFLVANLQREADRTFTSKDMPWICETLRSRPADVRQLGRPMAIGASVLHRISATFTALAPPFTRPARR